MSKQTKRPKRPILLPVPPYLSAEAAIIWRAVVADLAKNGRLEAIYAGTIETYAFGIVRQRALQAEIDRDGVMVNGKPHPALRTIEAVAATVRSAAHCLGLTPASRKAMPSKPAKKGGGVWSGILDE